MTRFAYLIGVLAFALTSAAALAWDACQGQSSFRKDGATCGTLRSDGGFVIIECNDGPFCQAPANEISCCDVTSGGQVISVRCICVDNPDHGGGGGCAPEDLFCDPPPLG